MKQNLTREQVIIKFFSVSGMTGQNQHNWPNFSVRKRFLRSLARA